MTYRPMQIAERIGGIGVDVDEAAAAMLHLVASVRDVEHITDLELQMVALAGLRAILQPFLDDEGLVEQVNDAFQALRAEVMRPLKEAAA
jgi:hypothetical protein